MELERFKKDAEQAAELARVEKVREDAETLKKLKIHRTEVAAGQARAEVERVEKEREDAETLKVHRAKVRVCVCDCVYASRSATQWTRSL